MKKIRNWLTAPVFEDEQKTRIAFMQHIFLLTVLVACFLILLVSWLSGGKITPPAMVLGMGLVLIALWVLRRGYLTQAGLIFLLGFLAFLTFLAFISNGTNDTAFIAYPALITVASLSLNRRWFVIFVGLCLFSVSIVAFFEFSGVINTPFDDESAINTGLTIVIILTVTAMSLRLMSENLFDNLANARRSELALTEANRQLQAEIARRHQAELTLRTAESSLRRHNQELTLLNLVGQELNATLDRVRVNERLLQAVVETVGTEGATIWFRDTDIPSDQEDTGISLICGAVFRQDHDRSLLSLRLQPGQGVAGWVAQTGKSVMVNNVTTDNRFFSGADSLSGFKTRSLLTVPLKIHNHILGVLQLANKKDGDFSAADLVFAETLATSAAIALQNSQLVEVLRQRNHQLEQQNEELDAYAHTVAHDLKTPIARMVGFAEYLEQAHVDMSDQERAQHLQLVARNGRKMTAIINELLLLAGVRQAKEVSLTPVKMNMVVQAVEERLVNLIETSQTQIVEPETWPAAMGYAPWLEEVWANYISNAIKYGGQPPQVKLGAKLLQTGQVRFWVHDNGPGLKPNEMEHLFVPFTRLEQSHGRGHGLGLSIVRRIIEKMGGQVGVESRGNPGEGCTFWFTLNSPETTEKND